MIRRIPSTTQHALGAFFGIDQSTVSRYLQLAISYDDKIYPIPNNITDYTATVKTEKELR